MPRLARVVSVLTAILVLAVLLIGPAPVGPAPLEAATCPGSDAF